jgi:hypothetical protein
MRSAPGHGTQVRERRRVLRVLGIAPRCLRFQNASTRPRKRLLGAHKADGRGGFRTCDLSRVKKNCSLPNWSGFPCKSALFGFQGRSLRNCQFAFISAEFRPMDSLMGLNSVADFAWLRARVDWGWWVAPRVRTNNLHRPAPSRQDRGARGQSNQEQCGQSARVDAVARPHRSGFCFCGGCRVKGVSSGEFKTIPLCPRTS